MHRKVMADDQSEEFRRFILENREIIISILAEEDGPSVKEQIKERVEESRNEVQDKAKELNEAVLKIISDDKVQKHFITGCLEFLHFFEAVIDAAPLSPEAREAVDKFEETKDSILKNMVVAGAKDKMENITINDVKAKTSSSLSKKLEKIENISIRDIKDSIHNKNND